MRRLAALFGVILALVAWPTPAYAETTCDPTGLTCLTVENGTVTVSGPGVSLSQPVPTVTVPGPTVTLPATTVTAPPVTTTVPGPTETVTETVEVPGPVETVTETSTVTQTTTVTTERPRNTTAGQETDPSGIVEPTLATPPDAGINLIPDDPKKAAATYSLLGLIVGIIIGVVALYFVYRRGRKEGEEETVQAIRAEDDTEEIPIRGRHRKLD